jgi:hypothetical protein
MTVSWATSEAGSPSSRDGGRGRCRPTNCHPSTGRDVAHVRPSTCLTDALVSGPDITAGDCALSQAEHPLKSMRVHSSEPWFDGRSGVTLSA